MSLFKKIKDWWFEIQLEKTIDKNVKEFNKEVDENINMWSNKDPVAEVQQDREIEQKYYNGMALLKSRLRSQLQGGDARSVMSRYHGDKDFYLGGDLLSLAKSDNHQREQLSKVLSSSLVYSGADVKTSADEAKMIDKRINHYSDLQNKTEERKLLRAIKEAYKNGDTETHASLTKQWETQYGKSRNSKTRY